MVPPVAVSDVELPKHTIVVVLPAVMVGSALMVMALVVVFTQPLASVPVIVYVVATVGEACTGVPVVLFSDVPGAQL